ncbi:MAG: bifunctional acetate--CoA ligase family protein/GNAT family N-acetyltransferase [Proteobacteria bacterium]|nr:bifunctional acetate--CoA ligase family protein/GNAT family N-acetyltransferase [Pseudomonadota bacterium]
MLHSNIRKEGNGMGDLQKLFNPRTIAIIGATEKEGTFGRAVLENALSSGNRMVYPVNPNRKMVLGKPCWSDIGAVPGPVDMAIVATPAATIPPIVEACGRAGVEGIIIISAGFRETGEEGRRLEEEILRINRAYGTRIIGPNCLGIMRPAVNLNATFLRENPERGNIAFISDMGSFGRTLLDWGISAHIGFSMVVSLGSAIDVDFGDVIDFLFEDPHTKSIILYMEEVVGNVKRFVSAIRCFARSKPVILLKPPGLKEGDCAGLTHTGMMAGPEEVYDAVFRRMGVVRVREAQDLFNAASVLYSRNRPKGPRLAIAANANGIGVIAAKQLLRAGGTLANLSGQTLQAMDSLLPAYWNRGNPVDLHRNADVNRYAEAAAICLKDPGVDGLLAIYTPQDFAIPEELAAALAATAAKTEKPLLTAWMGGREVQRGRELMVQKGIPAYETAEAAVRAYIYMNQYERNLQLLHETPEELPIDEAPPKNHLKAMIRRARREACFVLTEEESRKFLKNYGIPVVPSRTALNLEDALDAARDIGYPVVLKVASPDIIFRQDVGGVVTAIDSEETLKAAYRRILDGVRQFAPQAQVRGVTVQKMVEQIDYELILGAKKDRNFGTVILFGMGGIGVQLFRDFSVGLPPLNQTLARRLMEETGVYRLLQGYRGKPAADLRELEKILVGFSRMIVDFPEIREMDMNPVAVRKGKAVVMDVRIILDPQGFEGQASAYPHLVITPYPTRYVTPWRLKDGTEVILRPIRPEDEPLEHEMLTTVSEATIRSRFYQSLKQISHAMHVRSCHLDYDREMAIVAEVRTDQKKRLIGIGSLTIDGNGGGMGEFAVIVHDEFQGRGLASKLLDVLVGIATERGLKEFFGFLEPANGRMTALCEKLGMTRRRVSDDLIRVSLPLK